MRTTRLVLIAVFMASAAFAQEKTIIHLWPGQVPGENTPKHPAVVTPDSSNQVIRLTDVTDPTLTVFSPVVPNSSGAAVIVCPGGGYQILAENLEGNEIAEWLNKMGYTAFVLQYRVPKKKAGALQDVQRAIRIVRSRAQEWKLDPGKIGVMGFSAGGSLSARISTLYEENWYVPVDEADSLSSRPAFAILIYPAYLDLGPDSSLTPGLKVDHHSPPMFIFQTADDPYGNSALVMTGALRKAKVPVELHYYPKGGHGYGLRPGNPAAEAWPALAEKWLKEIVGENYK